MFSKMKFLHVFISLNIDLVLVNSAESDEKVSEYDQEIPQAHTVDQPTAT